MPVKLALPIPRLPDWPACDRDAWHEAIRPAGWFDEGGPLARYSPTILRSFESAYGRWLGFLATRSMLDTSRSGLDLLDASLASGFYDRLSAVLAPLTVFGYLLRLLTVARALRPESHFPSLEKAVAYLDRTAQPSIDKRPRLVPIRDLYALGFDLMEQAPAHDTPIKEAAFYRDGLMIALLTARPIRLGNLQSIEIDRHLREERDVFWLVFPAGEVKNRRPLEFPVPEALTEPIRRYLADYRPILLARRKRQDADNATTALWITETGSAMVRSWIRERINARTRERFGHSINPHLFRDCAATSIAIEDSAHVGIILPVLGHARADTAERHYNQARSLDAARCFQDTVAALRGS